MAVPSTIWPRVAVAANVALSVVVAVWVILAAGAQDLAASGEISTPTASGVPGPSDPGGAETATPVARPTQEAPVLAGCVPGAACESGDSKIIALGLDPPNDDFANALELTPTDVSYVIPMANATFETVEPSTCTPFFAGTAWYKYTAPRNTRMEVTAGGFGEVSMGAYSGTALGSLTEILCSRNFGQRLSVDVAAGETIYIQVGDFNFLTLDIQVNFKFHLAPPNDMLADAKTISTFPSQEFTDPLLATLEEGEPSPCGTAGRSVWYRIAPAEDIALTVEPSRSTVRLAAYQDVPLASLGDHICTTEIRDDLRLSVQGGSSVLIQAMVTTTSATPFRLDFTADDAAANDNFSDAAVLGSLPIHVEPLPGSSGVEIGEPVDCGSGFQRTSVWYRYTAPADVVFIANPGFFFSPSVGAYSGNSVDNLAEIACLRTDDNEVLKLRLTAGQTIHVRVESAFEADVEFEALPHVANDDFATALSVDTFPYEAEIDVTASTAETGEPSTCGGDSVWYSITPSSDAVIEANAVPHDFQDLALGLYRGESLETLVEAACIMGHEPSVRTLVPAGERVFLRVGTEPNASSPGAQVVDLQINAWTPIANDDVANAMIVPSLPFADIVDLRGASTEINGPSVPGCFISDSVWYAYTATQDERIAVDTSTTPGSASHHVAVFDGSLQPIISSCAAGTTSVEVDVAAGETVYFQFGDDPGFLVLHLDPVATRTNDDFADSTVIGALPFETLVNLTTAGVETNEPAACASVARSAWFTFTAPRDMVVAAEALVESFDGDTVVAAYSGDSLSSLTEIACNDDFDQDDDARTQVLLSAGQTVHFQAAVKETGWALTFRLDEVFPPPNDDFEQAEVIGALPFNAESSDVSATVQTPEPVTCPQPNRATTDRTVWYTFTAPRTTVLQIDPSGDHSMFLSVYTGSTLATLSRIACEDGSDQLRVNVTAGAKLYIQVGGEDGRAGDFELHVSEILRPLNDNFADATEIASVPFLDNVDTRGATNETGEFPCGAFGVWYRFTPADDVVLRVDGAGSQGSSEFAVYTGSAVNDLVRIGGCDDPAIVPVSAGQTVYIRAASFSTLGGLVRVNVQATPPIANDDFANALDISASLPFVSEYSLGGATFEAGEPRGCGPDSETLWHKITAPSDLLLTLRVAREDLNANPTVAVYRGTSLETLAAPLCPIFNGPEYVQFPVAAGETVYIQTGTDSFSPRGGLISLEVTPVTSPANDDFANAEQIGALPFSTMLVNAGATLETTEPAFCRSTGSLWYRFGADHDMRFLVRLIDPDRDGAVVIYTGEQLSALTLRGCDVGSGTTSELTAEVDAGSSVYIQVDGIASHAPVTLEVIELIPPPNDNISDAHVIPSLPFEAQPYILGATQEPDEPSNCFALNTVWYRYTAPADTTLRIDGGGEPVTTWVVEDDGLPQLSDGVGCSGEQQFPVEAGQTVWMRLGGHADFGQLRVIEVDPPANDRWENATEIGSLPFADAINTSGASRQPNEPDAFSSCNGLDTTVWYRFTAPRDMSIKVDTGGSDFDTVLALYREDDGHPSGQVVCEDSFEPLAGEVASATLSSGEAIFVQVSGYFSFTGNLVLSVTEASAPSNDMFADAHVVEALPFTANVDTGVASLETGEPTSCGDTPFGATVWYAYTADAPITLAVDTHESDHATVIAAYVLESLGVPPRERDMVACAGSDFLPFPPPVPVPGPGVITFSLDAGETAYIQIGRLQAEQDALSVHITEVLPPANDDASNATDIGALPFTDHVETFGATSEPGEPRGGCGDPDHSVWYRFTAPRDVVAMFDTEGAGHDVRLVAYASDGGALPAEEDALDCDSIGPPARLRLSMRAGETVLIQVSGVGGRLTLNASVEREGLLPPLEVVTLSPAAVERELLRFRDAIHDNDEPSMFDGGGLNRFELCAMVAVLREGAGETERADRLNSNGDNLRCGFQDFIPPGEIMPSDFAAIDLDGEQLSEHAVGYNDGLIVIVFDNTGGQKPVLLTAPEGTWWSSPQESHAAQYLCDDPGEDDDCADWEFAGPDGMIVAVLSGPFSKRGDLEISAQIVDGGPAISRTLQVVGDPASIEVAEAVEPRIETDGGTKCGLPPFSLPTGSVPAELTERAAGLDATLLLAKVVDSDGTALANVPLVWTLADGAPAELALSRGFSTVVPLNGGNTIAAANVVCAGGDTGAINVEATLLGAANNVCTREQDGQDIGGPLVCFGRPAEPLSAAFAAQVVGPPAAMQVSVEPPEVTCDGVDGTTVRAALSDADGSAAVAGREVRFDVAGAGSVDPAIALTDADGVASTIVTPNADAGGDIAVTITGPGGLAGVATVECLAPPPTATSTASATATSTSSATPTASSTATPPATLTPVPTSTPTSTPPSGVTRTPARTTTPASTRTARPTTPAATRTTTATETPPDCMRWNKKMQLVLGIVRRHGAEEGERRYKATYDLNGNGVIGSIDLRIAMEIEVCPRHRR